MILILWISLPGEAAATKYKANVRNTVKPYVLQLTQHIGKSLIYISAHIVTHIPIHLQTSVNLNICIPPYSWPCLDLRHAPVLNTYCRIWLHVIVIWEAYKMGSRRSGLIPGCQITQQIRL